MSSDSSNIVRFERAASSLELALGRVISRLSAEWSKELRTLQVEARALQTENELARKELKRTQDELAERLETIKGLRIELRGERGEVGPAGLQGLAGPAGPAGKDGRDGLPGPAGPGGANGRDGKDGSNGKDGMSPDDFEVVRDGDRGLIFRLQTAARLIERRIELPQQIYRGIWEGGKEYVEGDTVTYGGGQFCARRKTSERPPGDDWQLCVKSGMPGNKGKDGERGPQGPSGRDGRDLTQLGADGSKW